MGDDAVRVAVRVRPLTEKEVLEHCRTCLRVYAKEQQVVLGKDRGFSFDYVFGERTSQADLYEACCQGLVESCLDGYNATVMAYGQTGSGKTFTMGSGNELEPVAGTADADPRGVIPRVLEQLFGALDGGAEEGGPDDDDEDPQADEPGYEVEATYLEIYNEEVRDLLHPNTPTKAINIRESAAGHIRVQGARAERVHGLREALACLESGNACRTTGSTLMNAASSRSHSLFTLNVTRRLGGARARAGGAPARPVRAKLHLVDLAGSERNKKTGTTGGRFKESVTINQGLLALGNVISALGDERRRGSHVPYRESKLTRMLQDSLGGNSRTVMLACVSPADTSFDESLNTLRYANRARNIKNSPVVNLAEDEEEGGERLGLLMGEIESLQRQLAEARQAEQAPPRLLAGAEGAQQPHGLATGALGRRLQQLLADATDAAADAADGGGSALRLLSASAQDEAILQVVRECAGARAAELGLGDGGGGARAEPDGAETSALEEAEASLSSAADSVALLGLHREHLGMLLGSLWQAHAAAAAAAEGDTLAGATPAGTPSRASPASADARAGGTPAAAAGGAAAGQSATPPQGAADGTPAHRATPPSAPGTAAGTPTVRRLRREIGAVLRQAQGAEEAARGALERAVDWTRAARAALGAGGRGVGVGGGGVGADADAAAGASPRPPATPEGRLRAPVDSEAAETAASRASRRARRRAARTAEADGAAEEEGEEEEEEPAAPAGARRGVAARPPLPRTAGTPAAARGARGALERLLAARESELAEVRSALQEAQADLRRDEEIFAERASELSALRAENEQLRADADADAGAGAGESARGADARGAALLGGGAPRPAWATQPAQPAASEPPLHLLSPPSLHASLVAAGGAAAAGAADACASLHDSAWRLAEAWEAQDAVQIDDGAGSVVGARSPAEHARAAAEAGAGAGAPAGEVHAELQRSFAAVAEERRLLRADVQQLQQAQADAHAKRTATAGGAQAGGGGGGGGGSCSSRGRSPGRAAGGGDAELALAVRLKEELIRDLVRQEAEARAALSDAEARSEHLAAELDSLRAAYEAAAAAATDGGARAEALRAEYERKFAESEAQIESLTERQRAHDRLARDKAGAERRLRDTAAELSRVRAQYEGMRRRSEAAGRGECGGGGGGTAKSEAALQANAREISELRKRVDARERRIRELESSHARTASELGAGQQGGQGQQGAHARGAAEGKPRRAPSRPAAAGGRLSAGGGAAGGAAARAAAQRAAGATGARAPPPPAGSSVPITPRKPPATAAAGGGGGGAANAAAGRLARPASAPQLDDAPGSDAPRAALDAHLHALVSSQQAAARLEREQARRDAAARERHGATLSRERVRMRAAASTAELRSALDDGARELARLEAEAGAAEARARADSATDADGDALVRLRGERAATADRLARLQARVDAVAAADSAELRQLDEQIDSLDAAIEWHDDTLADLRRALVGTEDAAPMEAAVRALAPEQAKGLLGGYIAQLVDARRALDASAHQGERQRAQLAEASEQLREQAASMALAAKEAERRQERQRQEHELEKQSLLRQLRAHRADGGAGAEGAAQLQRALREREDQVAALERDNFYFKAAAKELRRQLREAQAAGGAEGGAPPPAAVPEGDAERLRRENALLANELTNLKTYLLRNPSAQMVRVSKREQTLLSPHPAGPAGPEARVTGAPPPPASALPHHRHAHAQPQQAAAPPRPRPTTAHDASLSSADGASSLR